MKTREIVYVSCLTLSASVCILAVPIIFWLAKAIMGPRTARTTRSIVLTRPHYDKLIDVALCLICEAERLGIVVTQYDLVKAVFVADRAHLREGGRPITYDRYYAMLHGPVGLAFYNMLKERPHVLRLTGPVQWSRRLRPDGKTYEFYAPQRQPDTYNVLSPSDVEFLSDALVKVHDLGFKGTRDWTHDDPGYKAARRFRDGRRSHPMDFTLLAEKPNREAAEYLAELSGSRR